MRRYWQPIAASGELDENPTKAIRILCENLVLYKDRSGTLGLIQEACPHRRVNLLYGIPEEQGLRCPYHGWLFDETGRCLEQPAEAPDSTFKDRVKAVAYPVQELGGLVFAYLGPDPVPLLPRWDILVWDNVYHDIGITELDCNWLQCMENSLDPTHTEWLHGRYADYVQERRDAVGASAMGVDSQIYEQHSREYETRPPIRPQARGVASGGFTSKSVDRPHHSKIGFSVFEYGVYKRRAYEGGSEEDASFRRGHPILVPNILRVGHTFQYRIPRDDTHTMHILYTPHIPPDGVEAPKQEKVPYYNIPQSDKTKGWLVTDHTFGQDFYAWVTQAPIAERNLERLAESDKGIILYRRVLKEQMKVVADGGEPMGTFREPHDFIPVVTEFAPSENTFRDPERNKRQAEAVGTPTPEAARSPRGQRVASAHQRYSRQVVEEVTAMYEQKPQAAKS